ncbi:MAG TPA: hypothetical protein VEV65_14735 [Kineosporiaceae bacterium]|nr:hypothetical protein [Kineosporiaceae bacterium]
MLTALLVTSCLVMAVLFVVIASFLQGQGFRRAARADLVAALCCVVSAVVLTRGETVVPFAVLVTATLLGTTSLRAVRIGRG